jgi:Dyp-type peroxidase family
MLCCVSLKYLPSHHYCVMSDRTSYLDKKSRDVIEKRYIDQKRKQPGVAFPSATNQKHVLIIRFDISGIRENDKQVVRRGMKSVCELFDKIERDELKINELSDDGDLKPTRLSRFKFSATIGFGLGFFRKLDIPKRNIPKRLKAMPDYLELADRVPYSLLQTDFIIQLGSTDDYVNRWVFHNQIGIVKKQERKNHGYGSKPTLFGYADTDGNELPDIYTAIKGWARVTDFHAGFQRLDGKNLLGFNDGISNPLRLSNDVIWTTKQDENEKFQDGTYMVFQKIQHDLEMWQKMHEETQERWVGRSKGTGLLLGTLPRDEDQKLASEMNSNNENIRKRAIAKWKNLYNQQKFPDTKFYDSAQIQFRGIQLECPVWSHVRKANPRQADGAANILIFRRGYLFTDEDPGGQSTSGLLFICFQRDIEKGFEYIKKKFLNNENFPVPQQRKNFNSLELQRRREQGRFTVAEQKMLRSRTTDKNTIDDNTQNTGREGFSGPSENGVYPQGQFPLTTTFGGGYYFVPPIPRRKISEISEQFFD